MVGAGRAGSVAEGEVEVWQLRWQRLWQLQCSSPSGTERYTHTLSLAADLQVCWGRSHAMDVETYLIKESFKSRQHDLMFVFYVVITKSQSVGLCDHTSFNLLCAMFSALT